MAGQVSLSAPKIIADFAAGDGALLTAACAVWPKAKAFALDIDNLALRRLRYRNPSWSIGRCDFLSEDSRGKSIPLQAVKGNTDVILLNPPFSCRGASRFKLKLNGRELCCSKAMAFVLLATEYLAVDGQIVAILPESTFLSCLLYTSPSPRDRG